MHKKNNFIMVGGLLGATVVSGAALSASGAVATTGTASDSNSAQASVTVLATCSMTANVTTAHTATLPGGIWSGASGYYPNGIGSTTIATFCNDSAGYSIYAVGYTGNSASSGYNTKLRSSQLGSTYDIATGTATSGAASQWAMRVTKVTDSTSYLPTNLNIQNGFDSESYHEVPGAYTEVARYDTATDATLGSKINTTYSAYIAASQPASTYEGKVKYTLVHPGGTAMPEITDMQSVATWGGSLNVGEERTVRDSRDNQTYTVARLCTSYDANDDCESSQIWMTQNLNFQIGGTYASGVTSINSDNTDLNNAYKPDGTTLKEDYSVSNGVITWTPTTANTTASGETPNTSLTGSPVLINNFAYTGSANESAPDWRNHTDYAYQAEGTLNGVEQYEYPSGVGSYSQCTSSGRTAAVCNHYAVGNYYNWTAANAMSYSGDYTDTQSVMDNSICPKGWRLPKGIESGQTASGSEYNRLLKAQGVVNTIDSSGSTNVGYADGGYNRLTTTGIHGDPLYFARSGYVNGTTLYYSAGYGYYWSSSIAGNSSSLGYFLYFNSGGIWPASQGSRVNGFSVRCVARQSSS